MGVRFIRWASTSSRRGQELYVWLGQTDGFNYPLDFKISKLNFYSQEKGFWASSETKFINNLKLFHVWNQSTTHIVKGWFNETCRTANIKSISFLRLDGDLFESTWDAITALYRKVVPGGYIYVDDFGSFEGCREAINMFRQRFAIYEPLNFIRENEGHNDPSSSIILFEAVWWQKRERIRKLDKINV